MPAVRSEPAVALSRSWEWPAMGYARRRERAWREAVDRMTQECESMGGDGVVGVAVSRKLLLTVPVRGLRAADG